MGKFLTDKLPCVSNPREGVALSVKRGYIRVNHLPQVRHNMNANETPRPRPDCYPAHCEPDAPCPRHADGCRPAPTEAESLARATGARSVVVRRETRQLDGTLTTTHVDVYDRHPAGCRCLTCELAITLPREGGQ